ncbi:hypothetical protein [Nonomuraea dietziae]|uniref:Uncharacterized protein n=1 Tax=Nonomuraea dietziae TaxID=65515 RepID=A0A7W5YGD1_9ACTN|nr:hypothetical protein [Nonomuraea dietziae]MBB3734018.1 hypothetical protein [Nonomuraea dietziae]
MRRATNANPQLSRGWLIRRYLLDRATVEKIASEARCDESTIYRALTRHGLKHRGRRRQQQLSVLIYRWVAKLGPILLAMANGFFFLHAWTGQALAHAADAHPVRACSSLPSRRLPPTG